MFGVCHCANCRRRTGSAFGISAYFPREAVLDRTGEFSVYAYHHLPLAEAPVGKPSVIVALFRIALHPGPQPPVNRARFLRAGCQTALEPISPRAWAFPGRVVP